MDQTESDQRGGRRREWWKEGDGPSQRTCVNDPWTWTMVWEWCESRVWDGQRRAKGEN